MAFPYTSSANSATISTGEYSFPANTTSGVPTSQTTKIVGQLVVDLFAMAAGDNFRITAYEKVSGGTQRAIDSWDFINAQAGLFFSPFLDLSEGWDLTCVKVAGTDRTIRWAIKEDVGDRNVVAWNGTAPSNLISGRVDVDVGNMQANVVTAAAVANAAIDQATFATDALDLFRLIRRNTATAGSFTTITLDAGASATNNAYTGTDIALVGGTGAGQTATVIGYVGATKVATVYAGVVGAGWQVATPDATTVFEIFSKHSFVDGFQAGVITNAAFAANAIGTSTLAASAIGAANIATGAITSAKFAAGAIDAAAIATDAIGSAELAASAVTEIQTGLATAAALTLVQGDTDDIQSRLPAALVSGRMDSSVGAMAANVITAAATAVDFGTEIASAIWTYAVEGTHTAEQYVRVMASALFGKLSGVDGATRTYRDVDDTKDRIVATVDDTGRTAVTKTFT